MGVSAGFWSNAEVHTGAFHEEHGLVTYQSVGQTHGVTLHYDSLRAEPEPIFYFNVGNFPEGTDANSRFIAELTAYMGDYRSSADGMDVDDALAVGLDGGENFFQLPTGPDKNTSYGGSLKVDLGDGPSGVYTFVLDYGIYKWLDEKYVGRMLPMSTPIASVNDNDYETVDGETYTHMFGSGWGMAGYFEIFEGDGSVLLVDGNGNEQIFLAPNGPGEPFTSLSTDYSELKQGSNGLFTRRMKDDTVYEFNAAGKLATIRDRNGNETVYAYDGSGGLITITDPIGLVTTFEYDPASKRVSKVVDPGERETLFSYDSAGNLIAIVDPDGSKRTFEYENDDYEHLMTGQVHKRGNDPDEPLDDEFHESIAYNFAGRVIGGTRIDGRKFVLQPAQSQAHFAAEETIDNVSPPELVALSKVIDGKVVKEVGASYVDFKGVTTEFTLTGSGQYVKAEDDIGPKKEFERDDNYGLVMTATDEVGNIVLYEYDDFGNVDKITDYPDEDGATGRAVTATFEYEHGFNMLVEHVDGIGRIVTYDINPTNGDMRSRTVNTLDAEFGSLTTSYTYNTRGQVESITDPMSRTTSYAYYIGNAMPQSVTYADGSSASYEYDAHGNVSASIDENGNRTEYDYDAMNRLTAMRNLLPSEGKTYESTNDYDAAGNNVSAVNGRATETTFAYDVLNRKIRQTAAEGVLNYVTEWIYGYDAGFTDYFIPELAKHDYLYEKNARGYTTVAVYDERNHLVYMYDQLGYRAEYDYDAAGRRKSETNARGATLTYEYDGRGRMITLIGPVGGLFGVSRYEHDDVDRMTAQVIENDVGADQRSEKIYNGIDAVRTAIDAEGNVTFHTYDFVGNLTLMVEGYGSLRPVTTNYVYDLRNRPTHVIRAQTYDTRTEYDFAGNVTAVVDPRGEEYRTEYQYDEMNRAIGMTDAEGNETETFYDAMGNVVAVIDGRALGSRASLVYRSTFAYDALDRNIGETDAEGNTTVYGYDAMSNLVTVIDPRGLGDPNNQTYRTVFRYDAVDREVESEDPLGNKTETLYDEVGNVVGEIDARAHGDRNSPAFRTTRHYDLANRLDWIQDANGHKTRFDHDQIGNIIRVRDPRGASYDTAYEYDRLNHLYKTTRAVGSSDVTVDYVYNDAVGYVDREVDAMGRTTKYGYDDRNNLERVTYAWGTVDQIVLAYEYDAVGNLTKEIDPRGEAYETVHEYYRNNWLRGVTRAAGTDDETVEVHEYDEAGNLIVKKGPGVDGVGDYYQTQYEYDQARRNVRVIDAEGNVTEYDYDRAGFLKTATSYDGLLADRVTQYFYDPVSRLKRVIDAEGLETVNTFDEVGNLIEVSGPEHRADGSRYATTYTHDAMNQRLTRTDPEGHTTQTFYNEVGNVYLEIDPRSAGYRTTTEYDHHDRLRRITREIGPGQAAVEEVLEYDDAGNAKLTVDANGHETFTVYDHQDRATSVTRGYGTSDATTTRLRYDEAGNVTEEIDDRGDAYKTVHVYDAFNRRTATTRAPGTADEATERFGYDKAGNLAYQVDPRGDGATDDYKTFYRYDGLGRMAARVEPEGLETQYGYDPYGNRVTITDAWGNVMAFEYDGINRRTKVIDATPEANETVVEYVLAGSTVRVTDARGNTTIEEYDGNNRIKRETDADGNWMAYAYDAAGNVTDITDKRGYVTHYDFDGLSRTIRMTSAFGHLDEVVQGETIYHPGGNIKERTDARGYRTLYTYDNLDRVRETRSAVGTDEETSQEFFYDAVGNVDHEIDTRGYTREYEYDYLGRQVGVTHAVGTLAEAAERVEYDRASNVTATIDATGRRTELDYDRNSRQTRVTLVSPTHPDGGLATTVTYHDDLGDRRTVTTSPDGKETTVYHDAMNRVKRTEDSEAGTSETQYDEAGNVSYARVGLDQTWYTYDALHRVATSRDAANNVFAFEYDENGNTAVRTDLYLKSIYYEYDGLGRLIEVVDQRTGVTTLGYDDSGNLNYVHDPANTITTSEYDGLNRKIGETNSGGTQVQTYDDAGNVKTVIDRNGRVTTYAYDERNRRVRESWLDDQGAEIRGIAMTYDAAGRLLSVSDPDGAHSYVYDDFGRVIGDVTAATAVSPAVGLAYEYDQGGRVTLMTASVDGNPVVTNAYVYDPVTYRLRSISQSGAEAEAKLVEFAYAAPAYQLLGMDRYVGSSVATGQKVASTNYGYNTRNLVSALVHDDGNGVEINGYAFAYDNVGRLIWVDNIDGEVDYAYDTAGQLVLAEYDDPDMPLEEYAYDMAGNRTMSSVHGTDYEVGADNTLTTDGTYDYNYDGEGNLISASLATGESREFGWDYRNRLIEVVDKDAAGVVTRRIAYAYDPTNRRISVSVDDTPGDGVDPSVRAFAYDEDDVLLEFVDPDGASGPAEAALDMIYLHGPGVDQVLAQEDANDEMLWHLADQLGTVRDIVDDSGSLVDHIKVDAFGNIISHSDASVNNRYVFTGREFDAETGLYYYRARYYDPATGRFISQDPTGFAGRDYNLYRYASNSVTNLTDPSGLIAETAGQGGLFDRAKKSASNFIGRIREGVKNANDYLSTTLHFDVLGFAKLMMTSRLNPLAGACALLAPEEYKFNEQNWRTYTKGLHSFFIELGNQVADAGTYLGYASVTGDWSGSGVEWQSELGKMASDLAMTKGMNGWKYWETILPGMAIGLVMAPIELAKAIWAGDVERAGELTLPAVFAVDMMIGLGRGAMTLKTRVGNWSDLYRAMNEGYFKKGNFWPKFKQASWHNLKTSLMGKRINFGRWIKSKVNGKSIINKNVQSHILKELQAGNSKAHMLKRFIERGRDWPQMRAFVMKAVQRAKVGKTSGATIDALMEQMPISSDMAGFKSSVVEMTSEFFWRNGMYRGARSTEVVTKISGSFRANVMEVIARYFIKDEIYRGNLNIKVVQQLDQGFAAQVQMPKGTPGLSTKWSQGIEGWKSDFMEARILADMTKREGPFGLESDLEFGIYKGGVDQVGSLERIASYTSKENPYFWVKTKTGFMPREVDPYYVKAETDMAWTQRGDVLYRMNFNKYGQLIGKVEQIIPEIRPGRFGAGEEFMTTTLGIADKTFAPTSFNTGVFGPWATSPLVGTPPHPVLASMIAGASQTAGGILSALSAADAWVGRGLSASIRTTGSAISGVSTGVSNAVRGTGVSSVGPAMTSGWSNPGTHYLHADPAGEDEGESIAPRAEPVGGLAGEATAMAALAFDAWAQLLGYTPGFTLAVSIGDLPDGQLAWAEIAEYAGGGQPNEGRIVIDADANGYGWFVDATPRDHAEFAQVVTGAALRAESNSLAAGRYDLLTLLSHEVGHLLGFTTQFSGFAGYVVAGGAGSPMFVAADTRAALTEDGDHLDPSVFAYDLMSPSLRPGERKLPSAVDGRVLGAARANADADAGGSVHVSYEQGGEPLAPGFILFADDWQAEPNGGLVNGEFAVSDPADPQFGWNVHGAAGVQGGQAVLTEGDLLFSDLSQVFAIGAGATELRFTIASLNLGAAALNPPDAFEVALLDVATVASVLEPLTPLGQTDALLNIQPTGQVFFAPGVAVTGVAASGDVLGGDGPFTVHIDLSGLMAGSTVALFYDLIGFGDDDSTVVIGEVVLVEEGIGEPPVAADDQAATDEDTAIEIDVLANDVDTDGTLDVATVAIVTPPAHGQLAIDTAAGTVTYTPAADYNGDDSFAYTVRDNDGNLSNAATVAVTVRPVNDAPTVAADNYTVVGDQTLTVDLPGVLANDSDVDGDPLTAAEVTPPTHGQLTLNADGSFEYTPGGGYVGPDSFTYKANDTAADSNAATVTIDVGAVNHPPVAVDDDYTVDQDQTLTVDLPGVLANDSDVDGDPLTAAEVTPPPHGQLTLNADGSFEYTPDIGYVGPDSFTYKANDTAADSNTATVTIDVGAVNHPPVAVDDTASTDEETPVAGNVLDNDSDPDSGDALTVIGADAASAAGVGVTVSPGGDFTYDPAGRFDHLGEGETTTDTFSYTVGDAGGATDTATVTVTITGVNDAPVADAGGPYVGQVGQTVTCDAGASFDVDGPIVEYAWDWDSDGTWDEITAAASVEHVWAAAYAGMVTLRVTDDGGLTDTDLTDVDITDAGLPQNVDDLVTVAFGRVSYDPRTRRFGASVTVTNTSNSVIGSPVYLAIRNISEPNVTVANADGTMGGASYIDLSGQLGDDALAPGESVSTWIYFDNPGGVRFTFDHSVWGVRAVPAGGASVEVGDSFIVSGDAAIQFSTPLSEYRPGVADSPLVRPAYPDSSQYVDVTNNGGSPLILREIQINAPDVTVDVTLTADGSDDIVLQPGETRRLGLTYAPTLPSPADATTQEFDLADGLVILTSAADTPAIEVALRGASTFNSDVNYDGRVDLGDLGCVNVGFGRTIAETDFDRTADMNGDGEIDLGDLGMLNVEFGRQRPLSPARQTQSPAGKSAAARAAPASSDATAAGVETVVEAADHDEADIAAALAAAASRSRATDIPGLHSDSPDDSETLEDIDCPLDTGPETAGIAPGPDARGYAPPPIGPIGTVTDAASLGESDMVDVEVDLTADDLDVLAGTDGG